VTLQWAGYATAAEPVVVRASPCFMPVLDALFPEYQVTPSGSAVDIDLRDLGGGAAAVTDHTGDHSYDNAAEALTHVELALAQLLADGLGKPLLHAGGISTSAGALLLPGESGSGKSSLTAGLAQRGFPVLADDAVVLDADLPGAGPFKRLLKVHPEARAVLGLGAGEAGLEAIWTDATFYRPESLGSRWAAPTPVQFVVFPERREGIEPDLHPERPGMGVRRLMELVLQGGGTPVELFDVVARITEGARFFRLAFDDSRHAVRHLQRTLGLRTETVE